MINFSTIIITHGREELLWKCLDSLRLPHRQWQLILLSNGQKLSAETAERARLTTEDVVLIETDHVLTPGAARNRAMEAATMDWLFFLDDDAYLSAGYFEKVSGIMTEHSFDVLGGPDAPAKGMRPFSEALAFTLTSPFCTGLTHVRHHGGSGSVEKATEESLTSCNLWIRREALGENRFPEEYLRTEESALLIDLQRRGLRMFYHPGLVVFHHRRKDLSSLFRPTFNSGFFRSRLLRQKTVTHAPVYWLPTLFVLLHLTVLVDQMLFLELTKIYLVLICAMALLILSRRRRMNLLFQVVFLHHFIVFVYGLGFLAERLGGKWASPKK